VAVTVDPGPQVIAATPAEVGHGQTVAVAIVGPGLADDVLNLSTTAPGRGTLSLAAWGTLSYTAPDAGGADSIGYSVTDQLGDVVTGTLEVTVDPGPVAANGDLVIGAGQTADLTSFVNGLVSAGLPGDTETISAVSALNGVATQTDTMGISYTAPAAGSDTLTYTAVDQLGDTATGTIAIMINNGGDNVINGGNGDTIMVNGTNLLLKGGSQEMVCLGSGMSSIDDQSTATTVVVNNSSASATILDFGTDAGFVLDLKGSVGGYSDAAAVVSALQDDGHGGTWLPLGSGVGTAAIDFANTAQSLLTADHFRIG
jgi:hypothetical protein